jgi:hypothetical protein
MSGRNEPVVTACCAGPDGRVLRFVVGSDRLPDLRFLAPDAPGWRPDGLIELSRDGARFELRDDGATLRVERSDGAPGERLGYEDCCALLGLGAAQR